MNDISEPVDDKVRRRGHWQSLRDAMDPKDRGQKTDAISRGLAAALDAWIAQQSVKPVVAVYWPIRSEPDLGPLWQTLLVRPEHLSLALPVVVGPKQALQFVHWHRASVLEADRYGIYAPIQDSIATPLVPHLIVAPCLAFSPQKTGVVRLGYGGGFYDRTLSQMRCHFWGVAFDETLDTQLNPAEHDYLMQRVFTPARPLG